VKERTDLAVGEPVACDDLPVGRPLSLELLERRRVHHGVAELELVDVHVEHVTPLSVRLGSRRSADRSNVVLRDHPSERRVEHRAGRSQIRHVGAFRPEVDDRQERRPRRRAVPTDSLLIGFVLECSAAAPVVITQVLMQRATTNLAGLALGPRTPAAPSRDHLATVVASFTEGLDTADMQDAKRVLEELG
jgi:hypothetical protein